MFSLGISARALPLLSQSARRRVLDEARARVLERYTRDPAMPGFLRSLIGAMIRIFWVDMVLELEADTRKDGENEADQDEAERAAAPAIAKGMLQLLVVEARNLQPVHGIGTNPYVRAVLGQQVRNTWTAWSNLHPAWNYIMDFTVVSMSGSLEIELMSQAPLFGGDTRLGYVTLAVKDIVHAAKVQNATDGAHLTYRCEPLVGAKSGELVMILDYRPVQRESSRSALFWRAGRGLRQWVQQFRAFFLYHYWPCDKSAFQMYLREPVDITLLLISLSPFVTIRAVFYTILLLCLTFPWPPDEHQIVQFILAFKGLAVFDGCSRMMYGLLSYYICVRSRSCEAGGAPGSQIGLWSVSLDLYQELLVWCICFLLLPHSVPYPLRGAGATATAGTTNEASASGKQATPTDGAGPNSSGDPSISGTNTGSAEGDTTRGGRMKALLKYNLLCFAVCLSVFLCCSFFDWVWAFPEDDLDWKFRENFYWARTAFNMCMAPFLFLLHPQINKLLTHSTPTGYTRLGTLRRHNTRLRPRRRPKPEQPRQLEPPSPKYSADVNLKNPMEPMMLRNEAHPGAEDGETEQTSAAASGAGLGLGENEEGQEVGESAKAGQEWWSPSPPHDPVEDLKSAIRWFPGGSLALYAGSISFWMAGKAAMAAGTVVSWEIRAASSLVSVGLRAVDSGLATAKHVATCVPGSDIALQSACSTLDIARGAGCMAIERAANLARRLPGGEPALGVFCQVLNEVGFLAATAESPGLAEHMGPTVSSATPLLLGTTERAEALKLEAAGRLADMLTRAERLAEREVAEVFGRISPEIGKISLALQVRSRGCRATVQRVYGACDTLGRSVWAWSADVAGRLPMAGEALVRCLERELSDMQAQRANLEPGWRPLIEAYSRVLCSSVCEAFFELAPQIRRPRPGSPCQVSSTAPPKSKVTQLSPGPGLSGLPTDAQASGEMRQRRHLRHRSQSPYFPRMPGTGYTHDRRAVSLSPSPPNHGTIQFAAPSLAPSSEKLSGSQPQPHHHHQRQLQPVPQLLHQRLEPTDRFETTATTTASALRAVPGG